MLKREYLNPERKTARVVIYKEGKNLYNAIDYDLLCVGCGDIDEFVPESLRDIKVQYSDDTLLQIECKFEKYYINEFATDRNLGVFNTEEQALRLAEMFIKDEYKEFEIDIHIIIKKSKLGKNFTFPI